MLCKVDEGNSQNSDFSRTGTLPIKLKLGCPTAVSLLTVSKFKCLQYLKPQMFVIALCVFFYLLTMESGEIILVEIVEGDLLSIIYTAANRIKGTKATSLQNN